MSLLLSILALFSAAAPAETAVGSRSSVKAMQALHAYGRCVAIQRPVEVRALLETDPRDPSYARKMTKLLTKPARCPGIDVPRGDYASGTLLWSGAVAEGMLRRDKTLNRLAEATAHNPALPNIEARNPGEMMGFCVVRTAPQAAAGLLLTDPGTDPEFDAIRAMGATLSGCVPANGKAEFTRDSLRALIALGAYRLAVHNQQAKPNA